MVFATAIGVLPATGAVPAGAGALPGAASIVGGGKLDREGKGGASGFLPVDKAAPAAPGGFLHDVGKAAGNPLPTKGAPAGLGKPPLPSAPEKGGQSIAPAKVALDGHSAGLPTGKPIQQDHDAKSQGTSKPLPKVVNAGGGRAGTVPSLGDGEILKAAPVSSFGFLPEKQESASIVKGALAVPGVAAIGKSGASLTISPKLNAATLTASKSSDLSAGSKTAAIPLLAKSPANSAASAASGTSSLSASAVQPLSATVATAPVIGTADLKTSAADAPAASTTGVRRAMALSVLPTGSIILDSTLGQTGQPAITTNGNGQNDYGIDSGLGKFIAGGNLFFSFSQFGLLTGESATFTDNGGLGVQNILARVTGGGVSNIDGAINVNIPGANLFLMNPAGFVFGPSAQLNVPGSFTVTTADYLKFADGTRFTALSGPDDATLSAAAVTAFGFLPGKATPPGTVSFSGSFLSTPDAMDFAVIAGDQTYDAANLSAPGGHVTLVSVAGSGEVPALPATLAATPLEALPALGTITMLNFASVSAGTFGTGEAGHVEIDANVVDMSRSNIDASTLFVFSGTVQTDLSSVLVRSQSLLMSGSTISSDASGIGLGGVLDIRADTVAMSDFSKIESSAFDQATGGNITMAATTLSVTGSSIQTTTYGSGRAGNIDVAASNLSIVGTGSFLAAGIFAESGANGVGNATGQGGDVNVTANHLNLASGGQISANTFGPGPGGNVSVMAGDVLISGSSTFDNFGTPIVFQSGIFSSSILSGDLGTGGKGGSIRLSANGLRITDGGQISSSTLGSGDGGSVSVTAQTAILDGTGSALPTGISATTNFERGGRGGDIVLSTGSLTVQGGAEINAATLGTGAGGSIAVMGGSVTVTGIGSIITAQTLALDGGAGGNLKFNVSSMAVLDAGQISASTQGSGRGGSIEITTDQLTVDGKASIRADTSGKSTTVSSEPFVESLSVTLTADYPSVEDLTATLFTPGGNSILLFNTGDATGTNFTGTTFSDTGATPISGGTAPYTATFQPAVPLSLLNGSTANGTWQLGILELGFGSGTLQSWSLTVNGTVFNSSDVPQTLSPFTMITPTVTVSLPAIQTQIRPGSGGDIQINAGTINLRNGGTVTASTLGDGAAGSLQVRANSVTIDASHATSDTGFFASTLAGSTGRGGSISIVANQFLVNGSSRSGVAGGVVARSTTKAPAGDIAIQSTDVTLDNTAIISSANLGSGPAGSVKIAASDSIILQGGSVVTVVAEQSNAGTISLIAGHNVELHDGSTVTAAAGAGGGSIVITTGDNFFLDHSSIVATAGLGAGGNITIDPMFIILDHGLISANAAAGAGGNIFIEGQYFFSNETPITATGTTAGTVQITTLPLDIVNALAELQGGFIDVSSALQERCAMRLGTDFSSFLVIGRGGVEDSPDDPQTETVSHPKQKAKGKARSR